MRFHWLKELILVNNKRLFASSWVEEEKVFLMNQLGIDYGFSAFDKATFINVLDCCRMIRVYMFFSLFMNELFPFFFVFIPFRSM